VERGRGDIGDAERIRWPRRSLDRIVFAKADRAGNLLVLFQRSGKQPQHSILAAPGFAQKQNRLPG